MAAVKTVENHRSYNLAGSSDGIYRGQLHMAVHSPRNSWDDRHYGFLFIIGLFVGKTILQIVNFRETLTQIAIGIGMSILGWAVARLHLHVFDKWFLRFGKMEKYH